MCCQNVRDFSSCWLSTEKRHCECSCACMSRKFSCRRSLIRSALQLAALATEINSLWRRLLPYTDGPEIISFNLIVRNIYVHFISDPLTPASVQHRYKLVLWRFHTFTVSPYTGWLKDGTAVFYCSYLVHIFRTILHNFTANLNGISFWKHC